MFKKFLESFTLKDIIFIGIILILFLKMNKMKEKFSFPIANANDFKTQVETALGSNFQALQNLSNFATGLQSGDDYNFPHKLIVQDLEVLGTTKIKTEWGTKDSSSKRIDGTSSNPPDKQGFCQWCI